MSKNITIRKAQKKDAQSILDLIIGLAVYEKLEQEVTNTVDLIHEKLFGENSLVHCLLAEESGQPVGLAIYFFNYSTFKGKHGLYLEDFFVKPEYRGKGIGKGLFNKLISIANEKDCARMEWCVLDWNEPAINFYKKYAAEELKGWTINRLSNTQLKKKY